VSINKIWIWNLKIWLFRCTITERKPRGLPRQLHYGGGMGLLVHRRVKTRKTFKTSSRVKLFKWKLVWFARILTYRRNTFSFVFAKKFKKTCCDTEANGDLKWPIDSGAIKEIGNTWSKVYNRTLKNSIVLFLKRGTYFVYSYRLIFHFFFLWKHFVCILYITESTQKHKDKIRINRLIF